MTPGPDQLVALEMYNLTLQVQKQKKQEALDRKSELIASEVVRLVSVILDNIKQTAEQGYLGFSEGISILNIVDHSNDVLIRLDQRFSEMGFTFSIDQDHWMYQISWDLEKIDK